MKFNEALKEKRKESKLTQQEVADAIGITRQAYARYEFDKNSEPNISRFIEIAKALRVSPADLMSDICGDTFINNFDKKLTLGEQIKRSRKEASITQKELAEKIGKTTGFISMLETGRTTSSDETLQLISDALNATFDKQESYLNNCKSFNTKEILMSIHDLLSDISKKLI